MHIELKCEAYYMEYKNKNIKDIDYNVNTLSEKKK